MKIGYARVSTDEQCLDLQWHALEAQTNSRGWTFNDRNNGRS